jgi:hypothetical protein
VLTVRWGPILLAPRNWALVEKLLVAQTRKKFPKNLLNLKVHYRVYKSPSSHIIPSYLTPILILLSLLCLGLPSGLFPYSLSARILSLSLPLRWRPCLKMLLKRI